MEGRLNHAFGFAFSALLLVLVGCQNPAGLRAQNEQLTAQNKNLQDQLARERQARAAAESERAGLASEINRLQGELNTRGTGATPATPATDSAFRGIEGIETGRSPAGNIYVRVPGDVLFAPGQVALKDTSRKTLDQIAAVLQREYARNVIRIEGYTDTDPIRKSNWTDNLDLSLQRAASVHRYLQGRGVDGKRMYAAGFGQWRPQPTKAQSRRVEILVVTSGE